MSRVIIIGAGASGLASAICIARNNNEVIVLERNDKCGKKLLLTGNGKCNYWNEDQNLSHYHSTNEDILKKIITLENLNKVLPFFDSIGIVPKIKNGYYYPYSNQSTTIKEALYKEALNLNVKFSFNTLAKDIKPIDNKFLVITDTTSIEADKVVIGTGSKAFPKTGSDGLFYKILEDLGHKIIKPLPALVQLIGKSNYFKEWHGIRTDVKVKLYENNKFIKEEEGEIQLTDYGISGICAMQLSGRISRGLDSKNKEMVSINFFPQFNDIDKFLSWLEERNNKLKNRTTKELLDGFLNYKLTNLLMKESKVDDIPWNKLSIDKKKSLATNIISFNLDIIGTNSFDKAQVVSGGVALSDINPKTMESLKVKGLYIVGELLDIDGDCGGYNLGTSWLTGIIVGDNLND